MSVTNDDNIVFQSRTGDPSEFIVIRSIIQRSQSPSKDIPKEEQGSIAEVEVN